MCVCVSVLCVRVGVAGGCFQCCYYRTTGCSLAADLVQVATAVVATVSRLAASEVAASSVCLLVWLARELVCSLSHYRVGTNTNRNTLSCVSGGSSRAHSDSDSDSRPDERADGQRKRRKQHRASQTISCLSFCLSTWLWLACRQVFDTNTDTTIAPSAFAANASETLKNKHSSHKFGQASRSSGDGGKIGAV